MIRVTADSGRKLVFAQMSGFLSANDVAHFAREEEAAVESMGLGSGEFLLLVDTSQTLIQPQDVVAAFQQLVVNAKYKARRIAIVRESSLTRMQAKRVVSIRENAAVFETREEAEAWLFAD